jgi:hypothetical protein
MTNPYTHIRDYQRWRRAVSNIEPHLLDFVTGPKFTIGPGTRVCTAGSCFAQHISRRIASAGFNFHVTEPGEGLEAAERQRRNFGVFSARYGNLYTVAQLDQLFDEAMGQREMHEPAWQRPDGRWVDPFRPQTEPDGHATPEAVAAARRAHLDRVAAVFREAELFVFTLGLTEAWRARATGEVFPLAPGVVAGAYDPERHGFHNYSVTEVITGLHGFLDKLKAVNPAVKVLLTVSPVPLIATYEDRHVAVATMHSKSVLRAAVSEVVQGRDWVDYFPSYEVITAPPTSARYFEADHREVTAIGVAHAMRLFVRHYLDGPRINAPAAPLDMAGRARSEAEGAGIVCDEEAIESD